MNLRDIYDNEELNLLADIGVLIEDINYTEEDMKNFENIIIKYINEECTDGEDQLTGIGLEYENILEKLIDFEDGEIYQKYDEGDEIELKDGRIGIIIDLTNEAYTISVNSQYQTGNLVEDIPIVESKDIYGIVNKKKFELADDMHEVDLKNENEEEEE